MKSGTLIRGGGGGVGKMLRMESQSIFISFEDCHLAVIVLHQAHNLKPDTLPACHALCYVSLAAV